MLLEQNDLFDQLLALVKQAHADDNHTDNDSSQPHECRSPHLTAVIHYSMFEVGLNFEIVIINTTAPSRNNGCSFASPCNEKTDLPTFFLMQNYLLVEMRNNGLIIMISLIYRISYVEMAELV